MRSRPQVYKRDEEEEQVVDFVAFGVAALVLHDCASCLQFIHWYLLLVLILFRLQLMVVVLVVSAAFLFCCWLFRWLSYS